MPPLMVPESFAPLLAAFASCVTAPTDCPFRYLVAGWMHCSGRHTVTGVRYRREQAAFPAAAQQRPTKPELARDRIAVVARWAAELALGRTVDGVGVLSRSRI